MYGCYSTGTFGFKCHQRKIVGDFCTPTEFRRNLLDTVGVDVGKAGGDVSVCAVQLPFDKDGKD